MKLDHRGFFVSTYTHPGKIYYSYDNTYIQGRNQRRGLLKA